MARAASPVTAATFDPRVILGLLLFGAAAFVSFLYLVGAGETGDETDNGSTGHALGKGLDGYAGLVQLLKADGREVGFSRREGFDEEALLILTPPAFADADQLSEIIDKRRYQGPTLLVLPKWLAARIGERARAKARAKPGWVVLAGAERAEWVDDIEHLGTLDVTLEPVRGGWRGLGRSGRLPDPHAVQSLAAGAIAPLVVDGNGETLAGFFDDGGAYEGLNALVRRQLETDADDDIWPVVVVAEPDLINNYGMADRGRALAAVALVDAAMDGSDLPVIFDLTLNGFGRSTNLLTLAFRPPFLAATLCLILAATMVGWRAFRQFGAVRIDALELAPGKRALVAASAGFVQRTGRMHLLGPPYAALARMRIAHALAISRQPDHAATEAAIDRSLAARGIDRSFSKSAENLRRARKPADLLSAARTIKSIERTLER